jgi:hypothetical protein
MVGSLDICWTLWPSLWHFFVSSSRSIGNAFMSSVCQALAASYTLTTKSKILGRANLYPSSGIRMGPWSPRWEWQWATNRGLIKYPGRRIGRQRKASSQHSNVSPLVIPWRKMPAHYGQNMCLRKLCDSHQTSCNHSTTDCIFTTATQMDRQYSRSSRLESSTWISRPHYQAALQPHNCWS